MRPSPAPLPESVREELAQGREARREAADLRARLDGLAAEVARDREDLQLARSGWTDPEALDLLRYQHGRLPEADRPDLVTWARSLTPDTAPRPLTVYLPGVASQAPAAAPAPAPATTPRPPQPAPGTAPATAPPTGGDPSADLRVATATLQAMRPGQPGYDAARERVVELQRRVKDAAYRR